MIWFTFAINYYVYTFIVIVTQNIYIALFIIIINMAWATIRSHTRLKLLKLGFIRVCMLFFVVRFNMFQILYCSRSKLFRFIKQTKLGLVEYSQKHL